MTGERGVSIAGLVNKMVVCFLVALVGAWALLAINVNDFECLADIMEDDTRAFVLDVALRTLSFLGFFMGLYYFAQLRPRLKRVGELVGDRW